MQPKLRDLYLLMAVGTIAMIKGALGYPGSISDMILIGLGFYFYYAAFIRPQLQQKQPSLKPNTDDEHGTKFVQKARLQFNNIREDLAIIVEGHNEGALMVNMEPIFEMYRDEIARLYPILYGDEEFDAAACRRMEIELATLLEEPYLPRTAPYDKVVLH